MKFSKLLQTLLCVGLMKFGVTDDEGGGAAAAQAAAEAATAAAAAKAATDAAAAEAAAAALAAKGKTGPSDEEAKLIKEVMDKKTKLKEASDKIAALEAAVKQFEGIDAEGVRKMLKEKQDDETRKLEEKGQWDSLKKQMVEEFGKEKGTLMAQLAERDGETATLKSLVGDLTVGNAFGTSPFVKDDMTMPVNKARVLYGSHFDFTDGAVVAYDKPAGQVGRAVLVDAKGDPLAFEAAIKKIVESDPDSAQLLKSKMKSGAGSKTTSKTTQTESQVDKLSGKDLISAALAKGAFGKK